MTLRSSRLLNSAVSYWRSVTFLSHLQGPSVLFLISNFRLVLNVVCFLLGNSPVSEFYMPTFRNTLSVPSSQAGRYLPACEDGTDI